MTAIPWTLTDPVTNDVYVMHNNPNKMSSPFRRRDFSHVRGNRNDLHHARLWLNDPTPVEWTWEGVIRSRAHYDALLEWARKPYPIEVTTHLGHTWLVVFKKFDPTDRLPTATTPVRMRYVMTTLNLGEVTP